jgi:Abnormal spindle-like microcephaly-assoc'd, ASPM-SPD-2-Hydin
MKSTSPSMRGRGLFIVLLSALALAVYVATSATAVTSGTNATLSPTSLTFSTQGIRTTSAAKAVTLINTGTASLTITSIAITGINAVEFAQTDNCGSSLAAGASCTISVTFMPTVSGIRTAAVSIADNAAGSPQQVTLSGIGSYLLSGICFAPCFGTSLASSQCPAGVPAESPGRVSTYPCGPIGGSVAVDRSRGCPVSRNGIIHHGFCMTR